MKFIGKSISILLSLALIFAFVFYGVKAFRFLITFLEGLDSNLITILITSSIVFLIGISIIVRSIRESIKYKNKILIQSEKAERYQRLIQYLANCLQNNGRENSADKDKTKLTQSLIFEIILWGGNGVIKELMAFQKMEKEEGVKNTKISSQVEKIILEIRKDLGLQNWGIRENDFIDLLGNRIKNSE